MPFTRLIASTGDPSDEDARDTAEQALQAIETDGRYTATIATDALERYVQLDFGDEATARDAKPLLRRITGLVFSLFDPETDEEADA